jgi:hypothetical protein
MQIILTSYLVKWDCNGWWQEHQTQCDRTPICIGYQWIIFVPNATNTTKGIVANVENRNQKSLQSRREAKATPGSIFTAGDNSMVAQCGGKQAVQKGWSSPYVPKGAGETHSGMWVQIHSNCKGRWHTWRCGSSNGITKKWYSVYNGSRGTQVTSTNQQIKWELGDAKRHCPR